MGQGLNIGLAKQKAKSSMFDLGDEESEVEVEVVAVKEEQDSDQGAARRGRGGGRSGGRGRGSTKSLEEDMEKDLKECELCEQPYLYWGKKKYCRPCCRHVEVAERQAKDSNQTEFFRDIFKDLILARLFIKEFVDQCGDSSGSGNRRGGFDWSHYRLSVGKKLGQASGHRRVSKTKKEFITIMVGRGQTADWADKEFDKRHKDPSFCPGICPDTKLQTVKLTAESYLDDYQDDYRDDAVVSGTKDKKNPKSKDIAALSEALGTDYAVGKVTDAFKSGNLSDILKQEFQGTADSNFTARQFLENVASANASGGSASGSDAGSSAAGTAAAAALAGVRED